MLSRLATSCGLVSHELCDDGCRGCLHPRDNVRVLLQREGRRLVAKALADLRKAAKGTENILPFILEAVRAYATLGEVCNTLREEWGEYTPSATL